MPDVLGFSPEGQPLSIPQEAAAQAYRDGKLRFKKGERVPVKVRGIEGTLPAEDVDGALAAGETELNFDPHGTAKAAAAGFARGLTLGGSDWLAVEGEKLVDPEAGEKFRQSLEALRREHGVASTVGELGGAILPSAIPGGAELEAANTAREAADVARVAGASGEAAAASGAIADGSRAAKAVADAQAASGATKGSLLARTFRNVNPYEYVGRAGDLAADAVRAVGDGRITNLASPLAKYATEGALLGAANAADEAELGDTNLTGEAILANMEHGALWGTGLGLVGSGAARILTGAGRMANRLAEAQLGGSPLEMRRALKKYGPGALGTRMLEEGWSPFMGAEKQYEWATGMNERDGETLGRVVSDADKTYEGAPAQEVFNSALDNMAAARKQYIAAGGSASTFDMLEKEMRAGLGLRETPEPPPTIPESAVKDEYEKAWKDQGLQDPKTLKKPRYPSNEKIENYARQLVIREGAGRPIGKEDVGNRIKELIETARANKTPLRADQLDPSNVRKALRDERKAKIDALYDQAKAEFLTKYGKELQTFETANNAHNKLRDDIAARVIDLAAQREATYRHLLEAANKHNAELKVGFAQVRDVRKRIDKVIPWTYAHNADAVANAAAELKIAARSALEGKVEEHLDKAAQRTGDDEMLGRYLHAKERYAQSKDIARMAERGRARHAGLFGRPSRVGGISSHVALGAAEVLTGHPFAGAALGIGGGMVRHYGPKVAAWALYKATRLAQLKALRQEVLIGVRRGVRGAVFPKTAGQVYYRVQPKGLDLFSGHTSKVASTPIAEGHVMSFKDPDKIFDTYSWKAVQKNPDAYEMHEFRGTEGPRPEDTEGYAVRPDRLIRKLPLRDWLGERAAGGNATARKEAAAFAQVRVKDMTPLEARTTAAQAMEQVAKLASNPAELRSRLAALDPSLPILAPKAFAAAEGAFRRQVQWMLQQIPPALLRQHNQDGMGINPRDLTASQARDFFEHASATVDPRVATDALANNSLSANHAAAVKANWPAIRQNAVLQYRRMRAMDRDNLDFMSHVRKGHLESLLGDSDPSFTLALQANAAASLAAQPPPTPGQRGPRGMSHAAATSKGMTASIMLAASSSQTSESGPPGRRGRSGRSADSGL